MIIYQITNQVNNKSYIGKTTKSLEKRLYYHFRHSKNPKTIFHKALKKYGKNNFTHTILEQCNSIDILNEREIYWINQLSPQYNLTKGGDGGDTSKSPNYKTSLSKRDMSGPNNPMFGKKGHLNPKFGKKYGKTPNISKAKNNPCVCDGVIFPSITIAEKYFRNEGIAVCVRKRLDSNYHPN